MSYQTIIQPEQLRERVGDANLVILDCRFTLGAPHAGKTSYLEGHLPGAEYVDLERDLSSPVSADSGRHPMPDLKILAARLGELGVHEHSQVVVYDDHSGSMAARAWFLLKYMSHSDVALLDGGFKTWVDQGFPVTKAIGILDSRPPYPYKVEKDWIFSSNDVLQNIENNKYLLVDARGNDRYMGQNESIDPIAGHVPKAINRPFVDNLTSDGRFKSAKQLCSEFSQITNHKDVVHMCGSGVTACHNILAMTIAGFDQMKLYAGSWSQWITDPARPVAIDSD